MKQKIRKKRPQPPRWWGYDSDNCWWCKNRNGCDGCKILKQFTRVNKGK